jgi:hypothetical protein
VVLDDDDAYWRREAGISRPLTNDRAWRNFGIFAVCAVIGVAVLFGLLIFVAWITT